MNFRKIIKDNFGDTQKKIKEWAVHKENKIFFTQSNSIQLDPINEGDMAMNGKNDKTQQMATELFEDAVSSGSEVLTAGQMALKRIADSHFDVVQEIRKSTFLKNEHLISPILFGEQGRNLPKNLQGKIQDIGRQIHTVFNKTALKIEEKNFVDMDDVVIASKKYSMADGERTKKIVNGYKGMQLSYQSIRVAMELFKRINDELLREIESAKDKGNANQEIELLLKNAILVYELSNSVMNFIHDFQLNGIDALNEVYKEILNEVEEYRKSEEESRKKLDNTLIPQKIKDSKLAAIKMRCESLEIVEKEWKVFLESIGHIEANVASVRNNIPILEIIRDDAKNQLSFLQIMAVTKIIQDNVKSLHQMTSSIGDIELSPITPENICRLLKIDYSKHSLAEKTSDSKL